MKYEGKFKQDNLSDILFKLEQERLTGLLTIHTESRTVVLTFYKGGIAAANTDTKVKANLIGNILIDKGYITEAQLDYALQEQKGSQDRIGQILLRNSIIKAEQLEEALHTQIMKIVAILFTEPEGYYLFTEEEKVFFEEDYMRPLSVSEIPQVKDR